MFWTDCGQDPLEAFAADLAGPVSDEVFEQATLMREWCLAQLEALTRRSWPQTAWLAERMAAAYEGLVTACEHFLDLPEEAELAVELVYAVADQIRQVQDSLEDLRESQPLLA